MLSLVLGFAIISLLQDLEILNNFGIIAVAVLWGAQTIANAIRSEKSV